MFQAFDKELPKSEHESLVLNKTEGPLSAKALYELFLFSAFIFVMSALLLQFLINLQTAILLRHYSISFTYNLFGIDFSSVSSSKWPPVRIYIVYGISFLNFLIAGIILLWIRVSNWKIKLALTWMGFLMIHTIPFGMVTGIYFFEGFGIAYSWLLPNIIVRALLASVVLFIAIAFNPYWMKKFLKTAYSKAFLSDEISKKKFIKYCFILPWITGAIIISAFALPDHLWVWLIFIFGLGSVVLPVFRKEISPKGILIHRSHKTILPFRYPLLYFLPIIIGIWIASVLVRISF